MTEKSKNIIDTRHHLNKIQAEFKEEHDVFDECFSCAKPVRSGTAGIIIDRNIEKWLVTEGGDLTARILNNEPVASICFDCGNWNSDIERLRFLLSEELGLEESPALEIDLQEDEIICDSCSDVINLDSTRVSFSLCIAQIGDPDNPDSRLEVIPIRADEIFTLCEDCGADITAEKFATALNAIGYLVCEDLDWDSDEN